MVGECVSVSMSGHTISEGGVGRQSSSLMDAFRLSLFLRSHGSGMNGALSQSGFFLAKCGGMNPPFSGILSAIRNQAVHA